jgi:hypothetical protein
MWCRTAEEAGTRAQQTVTKEKTMVIIFWNFTGFHLVLPLPQGQTYTAEYCVTQCLPRLDAAIRSTRPVLGLGG